MKKGREREKRKCERFVHQMMNDFELKKIIIDK